MAKTATIGRKFEPLQTFEGDKHPGVAPRGADAVYGRAPSGRTWREENIEIYGYPCPRDHFLYGPSDLTPSNIATIWSLSSNLVCHWAKEDGWHEERKRLLAIKPVEQGGYKETEALAQMKERHVKRKTADAEKMIEEIMEIVRDGESHVLSPSGVVITKKNGFTELRMAVQAYREASEIIDVALGLPSKFTGAFAGATINNNTISVTEVAKPADSQRPRPMPLPEANVVDAEVEN